MVMMVGKGLDLVAAAGVVFPEILVPGLVHTHTHKAATYAAVPCLVCCIHSCCACLEECGSGGGGGLSPQQQLKRELQCMVVVVLCCVVFWDGARRVQLCTASPSQPAHASGGFERRVHVCTPSATFLPRHPTRLCHVALGVLCMRVQGLCVCQLNVHTHSVPPSRCVAWVAVTRPSRCTAYHCAHVSVRID